MSGSVSAPAPGEPARRPVPLGSANAAERPVRVLRDEPARPRLDGRLTGQHGAVSTREPERQITGQIPIHGRLNAVRVPHARDVRLHRAIPLNVATDGVRDHQEVTGRPPVATLAELNLGSQVQIYFEKGTNVALIVKDLSPEGMENVFGTVNETPIYN